MERISGRPLESSPEEGEGDESEDEGDGDELLFPPAPNISSFSDLRVCGQPTLTFLREGPRPSTSVRMSLAAGMKV